MNRIAFIALWAFVFTVPWELFITFPGFGSFGRLAGVLAFPLGLLAVLGRGRLRRLTPPLVLMAAFIAWSALSMFWSIEPESTQIRTKTFLQLGLLAWLIWELAPTHERQAHLFQAYVLGAYVAAFDTIGNYLAGTATATGRFAAEGFNPNDLGFTLVLGIPMAWHLATLSRVPALVWVNRLYVPIAMIAVTLTASRGAFLPALVALLIIPWSLTRQQWGVRTAVVALLAGSVYVMSSFVPESSWERLSAVSTEIEDGSFSSRGAIWRAGWETFLQRPVVGFGAGTFASAAEPALGSARSPHQTYLSILVGQGMVGFALFLAMALAALLGVRRLPGSHRRFWLVLFATLAIGLMPRTWEYRKPLWVVFGVLTAQAGLVSAARRVGEPRAAGPDRIPIAMEAGS